MHGDHRNNPDRNALAAFLAIAEQPGRIPEGSYLIIENLDRLTREDIRHAVGLLFQILDCKINVVTLSPEKVFYHDNFQILDMMMAVVEMSRAHGESVEKSRRLRETWGQKKLRAASEKRPAGRVVPAWIDVVGADGKDLPKGVKIKEISGYKFRLRPEAKKTVRQIFDWAIKGHGVTTIVKRLNDSGTPPIARPNKADARKKTGQHWAGSYVMKILKSRATFGEHTPGHYLKKHVIKSKCDPIPNYFPAVITDDVFHAAQTALKARSGRTGRVTTEDANPFTGLLYKMGITVKLHLHTSDQTRRYLVPATARLTNDGDERRRVKGRPKGKAVVQRFPFDIFEKAILGQLRELNPKELLPPDESAQEVLALGGRKTEVVARLKELQVEMTSGRRSVSLLVDAARVLERQLADIDRQLSEAQGRVASPLAGAWGDACSLITATAKGGESRVRLGSALCRIIEHMDCAFFTRGWNKYAVVEIQFTGGEVRAYAIAHRPRSRTKPARTIVESWADEAEMNLLPSGGITREKWSIKERLAALEEWIVSKFGGRLDARAVAGVCGLPVMPPRLDTIIPAADTDGGPSRPPKARRPRRPGRSPARGQG